MEHLRKALEVATRDGMGYPQGPGRFDGPEERALMGPPVVFLQKGLVYETPKGRCYEVRDSPMGVILIGLGIKRSECDGLRYSKLSRSVIYATEDDHEYIVGDEWVEYIGKDQHTKKKGTMVEDLGIAWAEDLGFKIDGAKLEDDKVVPLTCDQTAYVQFQSARTMSAEEANALWKLRDSANGKDGKKARESKALAIVMGRARLIPQTVRCYPPVTVCKWADGTITRARASEGTVYDPASGIAICVLKKLWGDVLPEDRSPNGEIGRLLREDRERRAKPIFKRLMKAPDALKKMVAERLEKAGQLSMRALTHATKPKHLKAFAWSAAKKIAEEQELKWGETKPKKNRGRGSEAE